MSHHGGTAQKYRVARMASADYQSPLTSSGCYGQLGETQRIALAMLDEAKRRSAPAPKPITIRRFSWEG